MNRTIKFQLSNVKRLYLFAALGIYGVWALFYVFALLFDGFYFISNMTTQPLWLILLGGVFAPFTFLALLYAIGDGLMFFDTALRFGISRKSYFITQMIIYILLTLLLVVSEGLTEVPWSGTASTFFAEISENYLSLGNMFNEFTKMLILAIGMLAVYRFKAKALIPLIFIGPVLGIIGYASFSMSENTFMIDVIINIMEFVINNPEITAAIIIALLISIYYLFVTKTEVQD